MVSKCHGREVREEGRVVAIIRDKTGKKAVGKQVSWKGSQRRRQSCGNNKGQKRKERLVSKYHGREVREEGRDTVYIWKQ